MTDPRFLPLPSIHNLRDYGGYAAAGGTVRRGMLWRSGHHADASDGDLEVVAELDLATVIDLRGKGERERHSCRRDPAFDGEVLAYDGETAGLAPHLEAAEGDIDAQGARAAMITLYGALPDREGLNTMLRRYFAALAEGKGASLVHCAAGKDRTGIAVDLLHHALGVHPDDAMADYLLTNEAPRNEQRIADGMALLGKKYGAKDEETARVLMGVEPAFLQAARDAVTQRFGSADAYLERQLGVDAGMREALRLHLVEG